MSKGLLLVVSGPSGSGKTTVLTALTKKRPDETRFSVSSTTRSPRPGEINGAHYNFVSREEFIESRDAECFLEWAEYAGNFYGTPADLVTRQINAGKTVILDIELRGALQVRDKYPQAILCCLWPGSFEELERRLRGRGTDTEEGIANRLEIAKKDYAFENEYKYVIINNTVEQTVCELEAIIDGERAGLESL